MGTVGQTERPEQFGEELLKAKWQGRWRTALAVSQQCSGWLRRCGERNIERLPSPHPMGTLAVWETAKGIRRSRRPAEGRASSRERVTGIMGEVLPLLLILV